MKTRRKSQNQDAARESLLAAAHSPTVRDIVIAVEKICQPAAQAWRKPLRKFLAELLFGPLYINEPLTRERINAVLRELNQLAAMVNPKPQSPKRLLRDSTQSPNELD